MDLFEQLQAFTAHLRIAHHIPGRIRLKLVSEPNEELLKLVEEARRFGRALGDIPGVRSVSLNVLARSCTVEYDAKAIPAQAWPDLLSGVRSPAAEILMGVIVAKYRELSGA